MPQRFQRKFEQSQKDAQMYNSREILFGKPVTEHETLVSAIKDGYMEVF